MVYLTIPSPLSVWIISVHSPFSCCVQVSGRARGEHGIQAAHMHCARSAPTLSRKPSWGPLCSLLLHSVSWHHFLLFSLVLGT